jgi:DNA-binding GntR family transcriptional regulator
MPETISQYIQRDLAGRIASRAGPPAALTITALARHYGVSFTPVREALAALVAEGTLFKQDNGRVEINPAQARRSSSTHANGTTVLPRCPAALESALADDVIGRSLRGEEGYLREEATAARHGVGRTAIRQVFNRLAGQGLIVHVPRCGWRVRPFDAADLASYLDVRESLELKALDLARPRLEKADLERMLAGNVSGGQAPRLDNQLHPYLVEKAENPYIRDFFERHGSYYTTLFDYAAPGARVVRAMAAQHRAILQALIDQDWPRARKLLAHHIRAQQPIVEELLQQLGRKGARAGSSA